MAGIRRTFLLAGLGLAGLAVNCALLRVNSGSWDVDFNQYYAAGRLAGTGRLYDWDRIRGLELQRSRVAVPFGRIPAFAVAFQPISALPYPAARAAWLCASLAALAGFVYLWPAASPAWTCIAILWLEPVAMCLAFGQDSVLFLFFAALGFRLLSRGEDLWAGLAFSACAAKPHLAVLLPVVLLARSRWRAILGAMAGGGMLLLVSCAAEGTRWPARLLALARRPEFDPAANRMPNFRGLLAVAGGGLAAEAALALMVMLAVWYVSRRCPLPMAGALALAGGLQVSHHAYVYDVALLLPALLLAFEPRYPVWLRQWAVLLLLPFPYLFLLSNLEWVAHLAITGYVVALLALSLREQRSGVPLVPGAGIEPALPLPGKGF